METYFMEIEGRVAADLPGMCSYFVVSISEHTMYPVPMLSRLNISLSVALLQIDLVLQSVIGRTTAIMAFLLSGAGLLLSTIFRLVIRQSRDGKCPNQWVKVSRFSRLRL